MGGIPIPKVKTEQGTRSLGQTRISLSGHQLLGSWGNSCSPATFLPFSPHSPPAGAGNERGYVCVRECSGRSYLPYRDVCSSRCTWCTEKSVVMVHLQIFPCGAVLGTLLRKISVIPVYFYLSNSSVLERATGIQFLNRAPPWSIKLEVYPTPKAHLGHILFIWLQHCWVTDMWGMVGSSIHSS